jgi:hypothetical protein
MTCPAYIGGRGEGVITMALKGKIRGMRMRDGKSIGRRGAGRCTEVSARVGGDCLCMAVDVTHC